MTPSLKLLPSVDAGRRCRSVISTLPPPMSMTTAVVAADVDAVDAARWMSRASSVPEMTRDADAGLPLDVGEELAAVFGFADRAGGGGDDLVDLVRFGQPPELRQRLERRVHRLGRERRPSRPPAPSRTISFSRSMTSNDRSGRTRTTIMWIELVPMSMAAMRMRDGWLGWLGACSVTRPLYTGGTGPSLLLYWPFFSKLSAILP